MFLPVATKTTTITKNVAKLLALNRWVKVQLPKTKQTEVSSGSGPSIEKLVL